MTARMTLDDARDLDAHDPLAPLADEFLRPRDESGQPLLYLCGNSLGLQPRAAGQHLQVELDDWARLGVEGHFQGANPWYDYHERLAAPMARVVGALPHEVVVMNSLTVNLHLMMISFYRPAGRRTKILIEGGAFPSDQYAVASQAQLHGLDPAQTLIELHPRPGEHTLRQEDILETIQAHGDTLALVMLGGVHYYTGQALDLRTITQLAHAQGARVGFDLAHAAGNLALNLHQDGPDFAVWCSYKYLNGGPGGVAGCFVHERHAHDPQLLRLAGWWGNDPKQRFTMPERFIPQPGAAGWQLSNAPVLSMAALMASLELFDRAGGMAALRAKSQRQSAALLALLEDIPDQRLQVITPRDPAQRGCQLSLRVVGADGPALFERLSRLGVRCDFRRPDVIRVAPTPLYNSFQDVWRFAELLRQALDA